WDTGIGIPEDKTAEIFEEFRQLGNQERNSERGTGLGLAIVRKTAALMGLEVRVSSRLGRGSMFAIELPLVNAGEPTP
ncbi:MAG: sensor histidine kinase, partial [Rhodospirillaceae bacterium]|nr:sensor histidine kinase [Rhodospirillales bacterium]